MLSSVLAAPAPRKLVGCPVVIGEDVGQILDAGRRLRSDPTLLRRRDEKPGRIAAAVVTTTSRARMCQKAYSVSPSMEERRARRTSCFCESSRSVSMTVVTSRSPIWAIAPAQNTFPITAASASIDFASADSVSNLAAISAWIDSGNGDLRAVTKLPARALLDEEVLVPQQAHELFGVERIAP